MSSPSPNYESFINLSRMASSHLTHLSLASTHRTSIAFFLLFITIFVVPFLSLSTSELIPTALPSIAYTLWDSLLSILTCSPFYFFLLNFLIVALVFSSGVLEPSSSPGREFDRLHEGDLHQRGLHNYSTAAQMIHERLALDELYESQASSLPYLNISESSRIYVADDGMIGNGYGDEGEAHNDNGKQIMTDPIASFLFQRPAFSDADGGDALEERSNSGKMDAIIDDFFVAGSTVGDESDMKKISPVSSVVEIVDLHDAYKGIHAKENQVYDTSLQAERDLDGFADADADADAEHDKDKGADVISNDPEDDNDVIHDEDGDDDVDDMNVQNDQECDGIEAEADEHGKVWRRIARTPSQPIIAGTIHTQQRENVGAEMGLSGEEERMWVQKWGSQQEERGELMGVSSSSEGIAMEVQGEELIMSMSTEELNERASAFITAFRKKLISNSN